VAVPTTGRAGPAELGVPHQRRQVVDDHRHAYVVDRAVGRYPDRPVGHRVSAEQPHVTGAGEVKGLLEINARDGHGLA
jgi:hypothetical protein